MHAEYSDAYADYIKWLNANYPNKSAAMSEHNKLQFVADALRQVSMLLAPTKRDRLEVQRILDFVI